MRRSLPWWEISEIPEVTIYGALGTGEHLPFDNLTFLASKSGGKEVQHYHFQRLISEESKEGQVALGENISIFAPNCKAFD